MSVVLLAFANTFAAADEEAQAADQRVTTSWQQSYKAGYVDGQGRYAGGSEILHLEGHKGKLYAANSYWMDPSNIWPDGFRGGRVEDTASGSVDLLPTICGFAGIAKPAGVHLDGADLSPLLTEKGTFKRHQPLLWLAPSSRHLATLREGAYTLMGYRGYQLPFDRVALNKVLRRQAELAGIDPTVPNLFQAVSNTTFSSPEFNRLHGERVRLQTFQEAWIPTIKSGGFRRFALYDLSTDPGQKNDISKQRPAVTERLKKKLLAIYKDVMDDAPVWEPLSSVANTNKPSIVAAKSHELSQEDKNLIRLLNVIEQTELPKDYEPQQHQPYAYRIMASVSPEQKQRVGSLFKAKRRLPPKMSNVGMSFVRILEYVAGGEKFATAPPKSGAALPKTENKPFVKEIDPGGQHWHQWRGPLANGTSPTAKPPVEWNENKNVRWKVEIEGQGNASPIIWGDKVFLLTAVNTGRVDPDRPKPEDQPKRVFGITYPNTFYKFDVLCLDRNSGKEIWRKTASEHVPHEGTHRDADFASASPTTDGQRLYCWFGSAGLFCYDLNGQKLWERNLGKAYVGASLGEGCSPVVHNGKLVIVRDHARKSSIEVLDTQTGESLWKKERDEPNAWATPAVVDHAGTTQVITAASNKIRSYDLTSGDIIWECGGLTGNVTPCPIVDGDVVYCMSGYEGYSLLALPLDSKGDITGSDSIVWSKNKGTPYVPSPVLHQETLYFTQSNQAILTSLNAKTGDTVIARNRLPGLKGVYSSPVAAEAKIYLTGRRGTTLVIEHIPGGGSERRQDVGQSGDPQRLTSFATRILATNKLDDEFHASPALVGKQLFLRGRKRLYCIEETKSVRSKTRTSIEKQTKIHRLESKNRSTFDAFAYVNRIPTKPYPQEPAEDFSGRIFGRLANQEGRVLLKMPPGMSLSAYEGFKTFLEYEGTESVGNCAACHTLPSFTDGALHLVRLEAKATQTGSLRNLSERKLDVSKVLRGKFEIAKQKQSGKAEGVSEAYSAMRLNEQDLTNLAAFLKLLDDVPDERFRQLILEAKVLDTSRE